MIGDEMSETVQTLFLEKHNRDDENIRGFILEIERETGLASIADVFEGSEKDVRHVLRGYSHFIRYVNVSRHIVATSGVKNTEKIGSHECIPVTKRTLTKTAFKHLRVLNREE